MLVILVVMVEGCVGDSVGCSSNVLNSAGGEAADAMAQDSRLRKRRNAMGRNSMSKKRRSEISAFSLAGVAPRARKQTYLPQPPGAGY